MKFFILLLLISINSISFAQIKAFTEKGDTVLLHKDGSWEFQTEYSIEDSSKDSIIDTNAISFVKDKASTEVVKGQKVNYELWYDPGKWKLTGGNDFSEYTLMNTNGDAFCTVIPEKIPMTLEAIKSVAIINARKADPKVKLIDEEIRKVNGTYVLMMTLTGNLHGLKFTYYGYYYAAENSSIQLITYTFNSLFDNYKSDLEDILNGLIIKK